MTYRIHDSGNVLFLVLIAVILFAALSFAALRTSRSVGDVSTEEARLQASKMYNYGIQIDTAVMRLRAGRDCPSDKIDFYNTRWQKQNNTLLVSANPNAPADQSCNVFDGAGGAANLQIFPEGIVPLPSTSATTGKEGHPFIRAIPVAGFGESDKNETILVVNGLNPAICAAINNLTRKTNIPVTGESKAGWTVSYWLDGPNGALGDEDTSLTGQKAFCFKNTDDNSYTFGYVLIER